MSKKSAYKCDGPGCAVLEPARELSIGGATMPDGWLQIWDGHTDWHVHSVACLIRFAGEMPQTTVSASAMELQRVTR